MRFAPFALLTIVGTSGLAAQQPLGADAAGWRADLQLLTTELPRRHPNPFARIGRSSWDSAVADLDGRLPRLTANQATAEFFRLLALLGDAHTAMQQPPDPETRFYPVELYAFDDGVFVRRAAPDRADLVGARVLRIGTASADDAIGAVGTTISHENDWWIKAWAPLRLMTPAIVNGLGLAPNPARLSLVIERGGRVDTVIVAPTAGASHGHGPWPIAMTGWVSMRTAAAPLWEQHPERAFWWTYLPDSRTLYVGYHAVLFVDGRLLNQRFWDEVFAVADTTPIEHFVLDIRSNTGGNGFLNRHLIQQILRRPRLDRPDVLYAVIGRMTFSAAQQLANDLEWWTHATFVGEPTGQQPSQYGDHEPLDLPHANLRANISTVFHQAPDVFDRRPFIPPTVYAPLTSTAYRDGVDPALAAILEGTATSVTDRVARAVAAGDSSGALRLLREAQHATANRFRNLEADVNTLGYRLLAEGDLASAITVFALNTRAYPESANTYDSLGEALAAAGRRDEAIAAYRHALELAPGFPSAVQALQRLGAR